MYLRYILQQFQKCNYDEIRDCCINKIIFRLKNLPEYKYSALSDTILRTHWVYKRQCQYRQNDNSLMSK